MAGRKGTTHWLPGDPRDCRVRKLHKLGHTNASISAELECSVITVRKAVRRLGLKPWGIRGRVYWRGRREAEAVYAARKGWLQVSRRREADVLQALWEVGKALSPKEIWERIRGRPYPYSHFRGSETVGTAVRDLTKRGTVVRSKRKGVTSPTIVYSLAPGVRPDYVKPSEVTGLKSRSGGPRVYRICR